MSANPDVTVVTAVYNTMPYLTETLDSLLQQTIGRDRLEVVAVDDGSTDGSGEELDRFAAEHPDVFTVLHQPNSGGPAGPSNRGIDAANGRYVYFLGADDYLDPEALERLVTYGDEHGSDVVIGKVVGVNGRVISQRLFGRNQPDLPVYGPDLRWAMANTNLYRRDMLDRIGLRYIEGLPFGSDQPFMVEACVNARKVSVLADHTCYYAVKRDDKQNISYATRYPERLRCITVLMESVERVVPQGDPRSTIFVRHFTWEVPSLLRQAYDELGRDGLITACQDVADLVDRFGTRATFEELRVVPRVLLHLAGRGAVDDLVRMIQGPDDRVPLMHVLAEGVYVGLPGLDRDRPDVSYRVPDEQGFRDRLVQGLRVERAAFVHRGSGQRLVVDVESNVVDPAGRSSIEAWVRGGSRRTLRGAPADLVVERNGGGTRVTVEVDVRALEVTGPDGDPWTLQLRMAAAGLTAVVAVPPDGEIKTRFRHGAGLRLAWLDRVDRPRALAIWVNDVSAREAAGNMLRKVRRKVVPPRKSIPRRR